MHTAEMPCRLRVAGLMAVNNAGPFFSDMWVTDATWAALRNAPCYSRYKSIEASVLSMVCSKSNLNPVFQLTFPMQKDICICKICPILVLPPKSLVAGMGALNRG